VIRCDAMLREVMDEDSRTVCEPPGTLGENCSYHFPAERYCLQRQKPSATKKSQQQPQQVESRSSSLPPKPGAPHSQSGAVSPAASPALGGHSIVAKRATSPKPPKLKPNNLSRGSSPLGSRATSPVATSRATSPTVGAPGTQTGSPAAMKPSNKRKAVDDLANGTVTANGVNGVGVPVAPKPKKRKAQILGVTAVNVPAEQLKVMLIEWLGSTPNATTRECIHHFTPYLTDSDKKTEFSGLVREVAQLKGGVLVLRKKYQEGGSSAPSPTMVG